MDKTQQELAVDLKVSFNTVSRWVQDSSFPKHHTFLELAEYLGWSDERISELVSDWYENGLDQKSYRIAGDEFVPSRYDGDYRRLLADLIKLDKATVVGLNQEHEGTVDQWAPIFQASPYTWKLLVANGEVVGYWHFICMHKEYFEKVLAGSIVDSEITTEMLDFPVSEGCYRAYFIIVTIRAQDRNASTRMILNRSIENTVKEFADQKMLFSHLCATAFSFEGKNICQKMGMSFQQRHPQASNQELADIFLIEGKDMKRSHWGKNSAIQKAYREFFG